jgi:hypothetical protein
MAHKAIAADYPAFLGIARAKWQSPNELPGTRNRLKQKRILL